MTENGKECLYVMLFLILPVEIGLFILNLFI